MADYIIKSGDNGSKIEAVLKSQGVAADLTGATVVFKMRPKNSATTTVDSAATVVSASAGTVEYAFVSGDIDTPGAYLGEFEVTVGAVISTFPSDEYIDIVVVEDLG